MNVATVSTESAIAGGAAVVGAVAVAVAPPAAAAAGDALAAAGGALSSLWSTTTATASLAVAWAYGNIPRMGEIQDFIADFLAGHYNPTPEPITNLGGLAAELYDIANEIWKQYNESQENQESKCSNP